MIRSGAAIRRAGANCYAGKPRLSAHNRLQCRRSNGLNGGNGFIVSVSGRANRQHMPIFAVRIANKCHIMAYAVHPTGF